MLSSADYWMYDSSVYGWSLGGTGYIPVPADYDGNGKADPAVRSDLSSLRSRSYFGGVGPSPAVVPTLREVGTKAGTGNAWIVMFAPNSPKSRDDGG